MSNMKCLIELSKRDGSNISCVTSYTKRKCRCINCVTWQQNYSLNWRKNNPEYNTLNRDKDKRIISNKRWVENNKDKVKESYTKWYRLNQDKKIKQNSDWYKNNKERKNSHSRKRRANKKLVISKPYLESEVLNLYGTKCYLCNKEIDLLAPRSIGKENWQMSFHIDHVIPLSKNGNDTIENVRPSHAVCNLKKGSRI